MGEITGLKTKFQRATDDGLGGTTWTNVAGVANISPPQLERDVVEVEDLDPIDEIKQKLAGLIDAGEVSLTLNFDPANTGHAALEADFYAGDAKQYRILLPNSYAWTVSAFVSSWAPSEISAGEVLQAEATFTLTGKPVLAPVV